jgi:hypothetical protein
MFPGRSAEDVSDVAEYAIVALVASYMLNAKDLLENISVWSRRRVVSIPNMEAAKLFGWKLVSKKVLVSGARPWGILFICALIEDRIEW